MYQPLQKGDQVFWHDPENGLASQWGTIHSIDHEEKTATIADGNTEVYLHELSRLE